MATAYKVLGQAAPANTNNTDLLTVGSGKSMVISTLHIANVNGSAVAATVYVRVAGAAASNANTLIPTISVPANSVYAFTEGITLAATDVITVKSATANALTFMAFGSEIS